MGALLSRGPRTVLDPRIAVACACAAAAGEAASGDAAVALPCAGGVLLAAIDGIGHGAAAVTASARAVALLSAHPDETLERLVARCHDDLKGTRGAALTLARLDPGAGTLTWLAVGNVAGVVLPSGGGPPGPAVLQLAGVVGAQLPPQLLPATVALEPGDGLLLHTDGIDPAVADRVRVRGELGPLADGLLRRHRRGDDDALVLLARREAEPVSAGSIVS